MKHNRFTLYIIFSAFLHCSIFSLFYHYGPRSLEKPENLVPVEVMLIKDMPLVSIRSSMSISAPKAFTSRPLPLTRSDLSTHKVFDLDLMAYQPILQLEKWPVFPKRSPIQKRVTKTTPIQRITRVEKLSTFATSINALPPEENPVIALKPSKRLIAVATNRRSVPVPDIRPVIQQKLSQISQTKAENNIEKSLIIGPVVMAPESEPIAIKIDHPPSLLFPGSDKGASFILLIDTSGSVRGNPLQGIMTSAIEFISLMGSKDRVGLMTLNDTTHLINDLTSKNDGLKYKIRQLRTAGKLTVIYDSLLEAGRLLKREDSENLHVVLFSDGKDEGSQAGLEQVIETLKQEKISVLTVGFTKVEKKYLDILRRIADGTGGVFVQTPEFRDILALYKTASTAQKTTPDISKSNQGALLVKSDPTDVNVYVDGKYLGSTPMLIKLPTGTFNVLLQNECCYDWQATIELTEPGEIPLFIKLERLSE